MDLTVEQALYGYEEGHRRLASSIRIDREADRILRVVTDLKVASPQGSYLTIVPLHASALHAFIKTWSAGPGFRPGSVWSHVLLMQADVLEQADDVAGVLNTFRRPSAATPVDLSSIRESYQTRVSVPATADGAGRVTDSVARRIVNAAYGPTRNPEVVVENPAEHENLLVALLMQGWPELRRSTALRTRYRSSETSAASFAVELVERPSARKSRGEEPAGAWMDLLTRDLEIPNDDLRTWLRRFGPDAHGDRSAVPVLVDVCHEAGVGDTAEVLLRIAQDLPAPDQLPSLKKALFGPNSGESWLSEWPTPERDRLALLLEAGDAVDVLDVDLGPRLVDLVTQDEAGAADLATSQYWRTRQTTMSHEAFFVAIRDRFTAPAVGALALSVPQEAEFLLSTRTDAWAYPPLWDDDETNILLRDLFRQAPEPERRSVFAELVTSGRADVASELLQDDPTLWWSLLQRDVSQQLVMNPAVAAAARDLLELAGVDRVGEPAPRLSEEIQLQALASVATPDSNLWRRVDPADWIRLASQPAPASLSRTSVLTAALASAERSKDLRLRERAWRAAFGELHGALDFGGAPNGFAKTLDRALPGGSSWDWCGRLREGLARLAVEADWSPEEIRAQASRAGTHASDVTDRVRSRLDKKQSGGLLDALARIIWH